MLSSPITQGYSKTRPHGPCTVPLHLYDHILLCSIKTSIVELFGLQSRRVCTNQVSGLKFRPQGTEYNLSPFWKATLNFQALKSWLRKGRVLRTKPALLFHSYCQRRSRDTNSEHRAVKLYRQPRKSCSLSLISAKSQLRTVFAASLSLCKSGCLPMMCYVKLPGPEQDILHASLVILQCIAREDEGETEGMGRLRWQLIERFLS